jgi:hypothetical protein
VFPPLGKSLFKFVQTSDHLDRESGQGSIADRNRRETGIRLGRRGNLVGHGSPLSILKPGG